MYWYEGKLEWRNVVEERHSSEPNGDHDVQMYDASWDDRTSSMVAYSVQRD
jgi:hypothetical protein